MKHPSKVKEEFDLAVDCSGSAAAMEAAVSLLSHGGRLCIFGVANPKAKLTIEPFQVYLCITFTIQKLELHVLMLLLKM